MNELDLRITNMDSVELEQKAGEILKNLPGIGSVRLVPHGIWLEYDSSRISKEQICSNLQQGGLRASLFQDSESDESNSPES